MSALDHRRVYRAHVEAWRDDDCERTFFVDASSHTQASEKIATALAAIQPFRPNPRDAIYNCYSADECIEQGDSEDLEVRLFEVSWGGGQPPGMCSNPVFLVENPGAWAAKWAAAHALAGRSAPTT